MLDLRDDGVVIRLGERGDVAGVLELWGLARSEHAVTLDLAEDVERLADDGALHVAERGGQLLGALIAAWDEIGRASWRQRV